jgi:hypothetical protein
MSSDCSAQSIAERTAPCYCIDALKCIAQSATETSFFPGTLRLPVDRYAERPVASSA